MAGRGEDAEVTAFVTDNGVNAFPHLIDDDGSLWASFGVVSQPAFVFINDDGTTIAYNGALGEGGLTARIDELRST